MAILAGVFPAVRWLLRSVCLYPGITSHCGLASLGAGAGRAVGTCAGICCADGSLWVHTDWHCDFIIRILLDELCGPENYRNQIAWCYTLPRGANRHMGRTHQTIYFYSETDAVLRHERIPYATSSVPRAKKTIGHQRHDIEGGRLYKTWEPHPDGKLLEDWWTDIDIRKSRHGYPTEKPLALLERIVKLSTDEGGLVIDPMMGSGVAMEAAKRLNRQYAGCDTNPQAVQMTISRLAAIPAVQPSLKAAT